MRRLVFLFSLLAFFHAPALAEKAPLAEAYGSDFAACHLILHLDACTHSWSGDPLSLPDDECESHVRCFGSRVALWDTPQKGENTVLYYSGTKLGTLEKHSEFQLVKVVRYQGGYYAMVRTLTDGRASTAGWVDADYIGCTCQDPWYGLSVPEYEEINTAFSLR